MQIEQVKNWLVLLKVFAWDHLVLSSHIYPSLKLLFHSGVWLKFSIYIGPVLCVYSPRLYSVLESFTSGWKRSRYNASPGIVLDITLPAIFQRECRLRWQWSKSERMFFWNSCLPACRLSPGFAVNANYDCYHQESREKIMFVCVHGEYSLQRGNKLWVTVQ